MTATFVLRKLNKSSAKQGIITVEQIFFPFMSAVGHGQTATWIGNSELIKPPDHINIRTTNNAHNHCGS